MENNEKKTLQYLNSKAWYRAIKVIYLLSFFSFSIVALILTLSLGEGDFEVLDIPNSKIVCQYGNEKQFLMKDIFSSNEMPTTLPDYFYSKGAGPSEKILEACGITEILTQDTTNGGRFSHFNFLTDTDPYRIEEGHKMQFGYLLLSLLITALITAGLFEAIRRIFYYVVLGTIKPQK